MPVHLEFQQHLDALRENASVFRRIAENARMRTRVPTCPQWDVLDLVLHQGEVHRWAIANLRGEDDHDSTEAEQQGRDSPDPLAWLADGADVLVRELRTAPADLSARVFLPDAPPPRHFWARRQAHEITMHAADALAAATGRYPTTAEVTAAIPISPEFAADGVDELLCGFLPRLQDGSHNLDPFIVLVRSTDTGHCWTVRVAPERITATVGERDVPDTTLSGTALALYLGLWNRGAEFDIDGRTEVLEGWRSTVAIRRTRTHRRRADR